MLMRKDIASTSDFATRSRQASYSAWRLFIFEEKMKSGRRLPIQKAKAQKDIADQFRELEELRKKVS